MKPLPLRTFNNYDVKAASDESALHCPEPTLAQQQFKEECDINTIIERFNIGIPLPQNVRMPTYGDFTGVSDFRSALEQVAAAEDSFMQMPASVRARFQNDPALFVDFCSDGRNRAEAKALGLLVPDPPPPPASAPTAPLGASTSLPGDSPPAKS